MNWAGRIGHGPTRPATALVVLDEAVLHREVGGPAVMHAQLVHLIEAAEQGRTTIQIVPFKAGAHAGTTGPFVILDFAEASDPDMVYLETLPEGLYLEAAGDVARFMLAFDRLLAAALHPDDSVALILRMADAIRLSMNEKEVRDDQC